MTARRQPGSAVVGEGLSRSRSCDAPDVDTAVAVAALPLSWIAGGRRARVTGVRWAVVIMALSPYVVRYATEARMYSLIMLLVLAGYLLIDDALDARLGSR